MTQPVDEPQLLDHRRRKYERIKIGMPHAPVEAIDRKT
jgi:hypothetical protein